MYFTDDSVLPENQDPLIITAAPYGPTWMPDDYPGEVPVTWDEQVQCAVDCYNAGATILHIHVRDPKTGHISKLSGVRRPIDGCKAVPKMVAGRWLDRSRRSRAPRLRHGKATIPVTCWTRSIRNPIR